MKTKSIVHLSTVHPRYDTRIFYKQCKSISLENKFNVTLIVADGIGDETIDNIKIIDLKKPKNIFDRLTLVQIQAYNLLKKIKPDIIHIHDPELIHFVVFFNSECKVIYDSHEDFPKQLYSKPYLNWFFASILSFFAKNYQNIFLKKFDYLVCATDAIKSNLKKINNNIITVKNYPSLKNVSDNYSLNKKNRICYVGSISKVRGIFEILQICKKLKDLKIFIAGNFNDKELEINLQKNDCWHNINYLGFLGREELYDLIKSSKIGLVILHPTPNHMESLPLKLFEYMASGTPVICSNFDFWKKIVENNNCGLTVNPFDIDDIIRKIYLLINDEKLSKSLGENGIIAIKNKFNWESQAKKLNKTYNSLSSI